MEFSIAQTLQNKCEISDQAFPIHNSCPSTVFVNPGIGQLVNSYSIICPLPNSSILQKKKVATEPIITKPEAPIDEIEQLGAGKKLDENVKESFLHPILTDSIKFPPNLKRKISESSKEMPEKEKRKKYDHKFHVV